MKFYYLERKTTSPDLITADGVTHSDAVIGIGWKPHKAFAGVSLHLYCAYFHDLAAATGGKDHLGLGASTLHPFPFVFTPTTTPSLADIFTDISIDWSTGEINVINQTGVAADILSRIDENNIPYDDNWTFKSVIV